MIWKLGRQLTALFRKTTMEMCKFTIAQKCAYFVCLLCCEWFIRCVDFSFFFFTLTTGSRAGGARRYLYRDDMMPRGCVLIDLPGLSMTLTKKLGIDAVRV